MPPYLRGCVGPCIFAVHPLNLPQDWHKCRSLRCRAHGLSAAQVLGQKPNNSNMSWCPISSPAASLVSQEVAKLNVALPLALACRDSAPPGCGPCVQPCGREGQGPPPSSRAPWLHLSELCTRSCGRRESVQPGCYGGGGEEPIVEVKNVSQSGGSKASLALEGRRVPGRGLPIRSSQ